MKYLIAGLGSIGRRHLRNLSTLGEKDIILYRTHQSTLPDDDISQFPVETSLEKALTHNPDAVIVANPTSLHLDIAIPAASAGCCLLLEKPISHTLERVAQLQEIATINNIKVLIGFQFRFHPGLIKIKQLLEENIIGKVYWARAHWGEYLPNWHPWEDYRQSYSARSDLGGGVALTLSHPLDYLSWFFGETSEVGAMCGKTSDLDVEVEDTAEINLRFSTGVIANVHLDYLQKPAAHHLEIAGAQGVIQWDNSTGDVNVWSEKSSRRTIEQNNHNALWTTYSAPKQFERNDLFLAEMRHFMDILKSNAQPICTLDDGIRALQLALAAQESEKRATRIRPGNLLKNLS